MRISRREILAACASAGCTWSSRSVVPSDEVPEETPSDLVRRIQDVDPVEVPGLLVSTGRPPDELARAVAEVAVRRCPSASVGSTGIVSHAFLGVAAGWALVQGRWPTVRAPLLQAAWFVAREARTSPYVDTPWRLPESSLPRLDLTTALAEGDLDAADGWVSAFPERAPAALARAATEHLGHLGHRAIFVAAAHSLGPASTLWRGPARYLGSHVPSNGAATWSAKARPGERGSAVAWATSELAGGAPVRRVGAAVLDRAVALVAALSSVDMGALHVVTSVAAALQLLAVHPDPSEAVIAAASWLDHYRSGTSELGVLTPRPTPLAPRPGPARDLAAAIRSRDEDQAGALALSGVVDERTRRWLAEQASHAGAASVQHSVKLLASVPDTPQGWAVACRFLARSYVSFEPALEPARAVLGLLADP